MNPMTVTSFAIPAFVAIGLIALLIKERYNLMPKRTKANNGNNTTNENNQATQHHSNDRFAQGKRYPDDFVDFSGGALGI
jgi:hypothetical protein